MDKDTMREIMVKAIVQIFLLILLTMAGLAGVTYIMDPESLKVFLN